MPRVQLLCNDGVLVTLSPALMAMSTMVTNALGDTGDDADVTLEAGARVTSVAVMKANEWCEHRVAVAPATAWDDAFVRTNQAVLIDIILVANYLEAEPLLDFGCNAMASFIASNSVPRIRERLGVAAEFTPEEEARMIAAATAVASAPPTPNDNHESTT